MLYGYYTICTHYSLVLYQLYVVIKNEEKNKE